jgi:hypothetical protein
MQKSESIGKIAAALGSLQAELEPVSKDKMNPHFRYKYADLPSIMGYLLPLMSKNGLSVTQVPDVGESGELLVETVVMHVSGEFLSGRVRMPLAKNDPQGVGSAITYARRYAICAMVGLVSDEDDDANAASGQKQGSAQRNAQGGASQKRAEPPKQAKEVKETQPAVKAALALPVRIKNLQAALDAADASYSLQEEGEDDGIYFNYLGGIWKELPADKLKTQEKK